MTAKQSGTGTPVAKKRDKNRQCPDTNNAGNVYGILFFIPVPGEGREYYRYSIVNGEEITDQIPDRISVSTKMHLKVASMIVRNPIRDTDYYLLRKGGVEDGK